MKGAVSPAVTPITLDVCGHFPMAGVGVRLGLLVASLVESRVLKFLDELLDSTPHALKSVWPLRFSGAARSVDRCHGSKMALCYLPLLSFGNAMR